MSDFFTLVQTIMWCGTLLGVTFIVLLAIPTCQLRSFLLPIIGWALAIVCAVYTLSPIDLVPEAILGPLGMVDDLGAVAAGITAAGVALGAGKKRKS